MYDFFLTVGVNQLNIFVTTHFNPTVVIFFSLASFYLKCNYSYRV